MHNINDGVAQGAALTVQEIRQQGACWQQIPQLLAHVPAADKALLRDYLRDERAKVVFTGAGTSGYVGDILAPTFAACAMAQCLSCYTTDIVANPFAYVPKGKALLLSFARSGNSPESVDAVQKALQLNPDLLPISVTCNEQGKLARAAAEEGLGKAYLMPAETHDRSFVMTSSFSTMTLFTAALLREVLGERQEALKPLAQENERIEQNFAQSALCTELAQAKRLIYLGSGALYGAAREAALKVLEMTAGKISVMAESALGFRHGPKSFIDGETWVVVFASNHPYTQQFDRDIALEIAGNGKARVALVATPAFFSRYPELGQHERVAPVRYHPDLNYSYDDSLAVLAVNLGQWIGLHAAMVHGISADNPSPDGSVNRVVQGVTLYPYSTF